MIDIRIFIRLIIINFQDVGGSEFYRFQLTIILGSVMDNFGVL